MEQRRKEETTGDSLQGSVSCGHPVQADLVIPGALSSCIVINSNRVRAGLQFSSDCKGYEHILVCSTGII